MFAIYSGPSCIPQPREVNASYAAFIANSRIVRSLEFGSLARPNPQQRMRDCESKRSNLGITRVPSEFGIAKLSANETKARLAGASSV